MFGISHWEFALFALVVILLFGGSRIPSLARSLGKSITEFKKGVQGIDDQNPPADAPPKNQS
jgi:sec-independent protein translocase protein TatA